MSSRWSRLRNLVAVGVLLLALAGGAPYPERAPSSDLAPVAPGIHDEVQPLADPVPGDHLEAACPPAPEEAGLGGASAAPSGHTTHVVARGETLSLLALKYRVHVVTIASLNGLADPDLIRVGQRLVIPAGDGLTYRVRPGDTLWDLSRAFRIPQQAIVEANGLSDPSLLRVGQALVIPGAGEATAPAAAGAGFIWPVMGRISSPFGPRGGKLHTGIDIATPAGTPIRAAAAGVVISAGWLGGYGRMVMIRHGDGTVTLYAHASELLVRRGQTVSQGQVIARVGSSGNSTGPHLHFEVIVRDRPRDPLPYLKPQS